MNKKILIGFLGLVFSNILCAKSMTLKSLTSHTNLDAHYVVKDTKEPYWESEDGKTHIYLLKKAKGKTLIGHGYTTYQGTYEVKEEVQINGGKPFKLYLIGLMAPNGHEKGTYTKFSLDGKKVIDYGTYKYNR